MQTIMARALAQDRFVASLLGLFALVALFLASVGLYGVVSYGVVARRREMGVRMALGAGGGSMVRLVLLRSLAWVGVGVIVGGAMAIAMTRLLRGLLFGVTPGDPVTFLAVVSLLAAVAAGAALVPALRAAATNPVEVLRGDQS
jgi:putative ABC transport system permease protein